MQPKRIKSSSPEHLTKMIDQSSKKKGVPKRHGSDNSSFKMSPVHNANKFDDVYKNTIKEEDYSHDN